jgi:hypothetical protein
VVKVDYFLFFANCIGVVIGLFFCTTSLQLLSLNSQSTGENMKYKRNDTYASSSNNSVMNTDNGDDDEFDEAADNEHTRKLIEYILLGGIVVWLSVGFVLFILLNGRYIQKTRLIVGSLCDVTALLYFAAPMSTMREVIRSKDSSSLYAPTIFINLLNGLMWFFYGLIGVPDMNVWIPNGIGAVMAAIQLILAFVYRNREGTTVGKYSSIHTDLLISDKARSPSPARGRSPSPSRDRSPSPSPNNRKAFGAPKTSNNLPYV